MSHVALQSIKTTNALYMHVFLYTHMHSYYKFTLYVYTYVCRYTYTYIHYVYTYVRMCLLIRVPRYMWDMFSWLEWSTHTLMINPEHSTHYVCKMANHIMIPAEMHWCTAATYMYVHTYLPWQVAQNHILIFIY